MTSGTLRQHAVAAEAIARGDLLFALYSGDPPPAEDEQLWLLPDGDEPAAVATAWQREAETIAADTLRACAAAAACGAPIRWTPTRSTASRACTSGRIATSASGSRPASSCTR